MNEDKPPYRVPTMAEVAALAPNGFTAASTFSGCGGSSLGYRMAGFRMLYANEFIPAARETYAANAAAYTHVDGRDIRSIKPTEVLAALGMKPGELDLLDGSPPCASFSTAGKRDAGWGVVKKYSDTKQRTDDLFFEFARILAGVQPKTFVAENVSGLVRGVAVGYFNDVRELLRTVGYRVKAKLLDAQWLGVPQQRSRVIFVGVRDDIGLDPAYPRPLPYRYSVAEACPWIVGFRAVGHGYFEGGPRDVNLPANTLPATRDGSGFAGHEVEAIAPAGARDGADISRYAIGAEWDKLAPGEQSGRYFNLIKASPDAPSPTILASHGDGGIAGVTHPVEKRKFSIAELRRICSFPDDFVLTGTYAQQWERLGRAVPPLMMRAVASAIRDGVLIPAREARRARQD